MKAKFAKGSRLFDDGELLVQEESTGRWRRPGDHEWYGAIEYILRDLVRRLGKLDI